jgi:adenine/guanine phosphoribosyltransferase-like PRPP-binding protein
MNGTTTLIVEAPGSSTGVILGGVSLAVVLSSLLGLALYVLRKRGVVTAEQVTQAQKVADDVLKSPAVAAVVASTGNETLAQVVETSKEVVAKTVAASETAV